MNENISRFLSWTKGVIIQSRGVLKEKISNALNSESITIEDLATIIRYHPESKKQTQDFLGITFVTWTVNHGDNHYRLMEKGKYGEKILEVDAIVGGEKIIRYRTYESRSSLEKKISLPADLLGN
ncbi:hypothetical protein [Pseudalkalibacillus caeni]|uniref:Uncharacterized protein n=1 Tax=Exobacillus caeni TaxID=2574798 RepID=A0A5R9F1H6_9BACL|nr:hypothetical protein [Pseudalkalibacillus caeni]TLS37417.1 hypothetical protein FCL54_09715 [Pseudalkalibacillus caeni]